MKPTQERVQQLPRLVRLLMLTAAVVLVIAVIVTQRYGPSAAPAPLAVEDEATEGPPPAGSYHRPDHPGPGHGYHSAPGGGPPNPLRAGVDCPHGPLPRP